MKLLCLLLLSASAQAVTLSDLKVDYNKNAKHVPEVKPVVGVCDGKNYYDEAALQGCQRNYDARSAPQYFGAPDPAKNDSYRRVRSFSTSGN